MSFFDNGVEGNFTMKDLMKLVLSPSKKYLAATLYLDERAINRISRDYYSGVALLNERSGATIKLFIPQNLPTRR